MKRISMLPTLVVAVAACGGGEPADGAADTSPEAAPVAAVSTAPVVPSGPLTLPDWFHVDADAQTVHMTLTAGGTPPWHFNDVPFMDEGGKPSDFGYVIPPYNNSDAISAIVDWFDQKNNY